MPTALVRPRLGARDRSRTARRMVAVIAAGSAAIGAACSLCRPPAHGQLTPIRSARSTRSSGRSRFRHRRLGVRPQCHHRLEGARSGVDGTGDCRHAHGEAPVPTSSQAHPGYGRRAPASRCTGRRASVRTLVCAYAVDQPTTHLTQIGCTAVTLTFDPMRRDDLADPDARLPDRDRLGDRPGHAALRPDGRGPGRRQGSRSRPGRPRLPPTWICRSSRTPATTTATR